MGTVNLRVVLEGSKQAQDEFRAIREAAKDFQGGLQNLGMTTEQLQRHQEALRREWVKQEEVAKKAAQAAFFNSDAYKQLDRDLTGLRSRLDPAYAATKRLEEGQNLLTQSYKSGMLSKQQYAALTEKLGQEFQKTSVSGASLNQVVAVARNAFFLLAGASGVGGLVTSLFEAGSQMERLKVSMTASIGSAAKGAEAFAFLRNLSERMGIDFLSTAGAFQKFSAAVQGSSIEGEKTRKIFEQFSGAARVLGLSAADARLMFIALEQMVSKGRVQMEELRGQLGERLPGAMRLAAEAYGVSTAELQKMIAAGLEGTEFVEKLGNRVEEVYGKQVPEASKTALAGLERLKNEWFALKAAVAENSGFMTAAGITLDQTSIKVRNLGQVASEETPALEKLARTMALMISGSFGGQLVGAFAERQVAVRGKSAAADQAAFQREMQGMLARAPVSVDPFANLDPFAGLNTPLKTNKAVAAQIEAIQKIQEETEKAAKDTAAKVLKEQRDRAKVLGDIEEIVAKDRVEADKFASDFIVAQNKKKNAELLRDWIDSQADQQAWNEYYATQASREWADAYAEIADWSEQTKQRRIEHEKDMVEVFGKSGVDSLQIFKGFARGVQGVNRELLTGHINVADQTKRIWSGLWNSILDEGARIMTRGMLSGVMEPFKKIFEDTGSWIKTNVFDTLWDYVKSGFGSLVTFLKGIDWANAFNSLVNIFAGAFGVFSDFFGVDMFAAAGLDIVVTKPTKILAGEAGRPEHVMITPFGGGSSDVPSSGPGMRSSQQAFNEAFGLGDTQAAGRAVGRTALAGALAMFGGPLGPVTIGRLVALSMRDVAKEEKALMQMVHVMEDLLGGAPSAAATVAASIESFRDSFESISAPDAVGGFGPGGDTSAPGDSDHQSSTGAGDEGGFQRGTDMFITKPTRFRAGETPERVTISPFGAAHGNLREGGGVHYHFHGPVMMDEYTMRRFKQMLATT